MSRVVALSTSDNPYNPITQFDDWNRYDSQARYFTSEYLDRICHTTRELGDDLYAQDIEDAVDEAVKYNLISWFHKDVSYIKVVADE